MIGTYHQNKMFFGTNIMDLFMFSHIHRIYPKFNNAN